MTKMMRDIAKVTALLDDPMLDSAEKYITNFANFSAAPGYTGEVPLWHRQSVYSANLFDLAGVLVGFKKAAYISILLTDDICQMLGIYSRVNSDNRTAMIALEDCPQYADEASDLIHGQHDNSDERQYRLGELFGYSRPSTDYFLYRNKVKRETGKFPDPYLPDTMSRSYRSHFVQMIMSPEHWREDATYARQKEVAAMALFPRVYNFVADWVVEDERKEKQNRTKVNKRRTTEIKTK